MAITPHFYLKDKKQDETSIYMGIKVSKGVLFKYYIKHQVITKLFDKNSQRAITDNNSIKNYLVSLKEQKVYDYNIAAKHKNINIILSNLENDTLKIIDDLLKHEKKVTKESLRRKLNEIYKPEIKKVSNQSFINYLDSFIKKIENKEKLHNGKTYGKGTIRTYKVFKNLIEEFNPNLKFDEINMNFYESFINFLNSKNYTINSVGKNIKFIKVIMRDAFETGLHNNRVYTHKDFRTISSYTEAVYLTKNELDKIHNLDLSNKPNYEIARDVFLCGCYTALRFSDYSRIQKNHIKQREGFIQLEMNTLKTNTTVKIPLKPLVVKILEKYDFTLPKTYEQKVNKYIKEVCKLAGIDENIEITAVIGGIEKTYYKPKYELVKTHTARRTGATLLYLAGVPPIDIMKITGHTKESNLLLYIRVSKEQTAKRLSVNPFFQ